MESDRVVYIYNLLSENKISIWIDGGWGIDALLGEKTRAHSDLDIVIEKKNLFNAVKILESIGFEKNETDEMKSWNFVMSSQYDKIDFHVIEFQNDGRGLYGPIQNNSYYPKYAFNWNGRILNFQVQCISPKYQLESHSGYELKEKDFFDMKLLCNSFETEIPKELQDLK